MLRDSKELQPEPEEPKSSGIEWEVPGFSYMTLMMKGNGFICDTVRLKELTSYAYPDLRKAPFKYENGQLTCHLDRHFHTLAPYSNGDKITDPLRGLSNGKGYYFVQGELNGKASANALDFGVERWEVDSTIEINIEELT